MIQGGKGTTRTRLIEAAAELIAASPGEDVVLREICDRVGVKMPTLYHFFGSKQGLLDAVVAYGFDLYVSEKQSHESSGDPIQDIRAGWDAHVAFGLANPGFYTLMYGKIRPGDPSPANARPSQILLELMRRAEAQHRLVVPADQAAAHILATNIGVTLRQIIYARPDPDLSAAVREGAIAAITGVHEEAAGHARQRSAHLLMEYAAAHPGVLGAPETALFRAWLQRLADADDSGEHPR
ncbi:TetR/AcrR family transcriptional regulator [Pseudoclavibacter sp. CFCC 13611]|uniref:TetR/AcrR family transcriptional regulator n=1 Tax=Pseudoclavibacter sp. CFCC 13611 TaxID=2615178 RepID=UPI001300F16A|nr:TetR/AcrR family transcriptional regulator [Pseudoclavibacter sp. CFCC 13611]KAB1664196.1 TetR/AcrR family transcriptional regulator [Pseudoclavibacter sp. CFCC 13611]